MSITKEKQTGRKVATHETPETMRAAAIDRFGPPDVLTLHTLPVPTVEKGEVLIALHTAGVGSWDAEMRAGWWPEGKPKFPLVLGTDGSGHIVAMGSHSQRLRVGDAVYSYSFMNPKGGYYAQYIAVAEDNVARIPDGLTMREAGAIPTTGLTAIQGIDGALGVRANEAVAIVGASGGVGSLAVQFAKLRGARVLAVASGDDGLSLARKLGADEAIDGRKADVRAHARDFAPEGLDAVLGLAGGEPLEHLVKTVHDGGRVAWPNGVEPEPAKRRGIHMVSYDAIAGVREFEHLGRAVEEVAKKEKLRVVIAAEFALAEAAEAHQRIEQGHVLGKIVLRIR